MSKDQPIKFSDIIAAQITKVKGWVKPDPNDHVALSVVKTILKGVVVLLMIALSPVMLIGLFLGFIGLM